MSRRIAIAGALALLWVPSIAAQNNDRVELKVDSSEANEVLAILDKRSRQERIDDADWQKLFGTIPYQRLKQRESSIRHPFSDEDFKKFVATLDASRVELRETLAGWSRADLRSTAERPLAYLPAVATIRASVYPVIKPQTNSFVFEPGTNAAIFLYLDPKISRPQFENTVAHELHHIGLSSLDEKYEQRIQSLPENTRKAARWMGAFGEGMAVLAAVGSSDPPPLAAYPERDQCAWGVQMERVDGDLDELNQFFLDTIHGDLRNDAVAHEGVTFFGYRGPWYTVGYLMATTIEKQLGRAALVETLGDARMFVAKYNEAASMYNAKGSEKLPLFSTEILEAVGAKTPAEKPKQ